MMEIKNQILQEHFEILRDYDFEIEYSSERLKPEDAVLMSLMTRYIKIVDFGVYSEISYSIQHNEDQNVYPILRAMFSTKDSIHIKVKIASTGNILYDGYYVMIGSSEVFGYGSSDEHIVYCKFIDEDHIGIDDFDD